MAEARRTRRAAVHRGLSHLEHSRGVCKTGNRSDATGPEPAAAGSNTRGVEVECSSGQASRKGTSSSGLDLIGVLDVGVD